MRSLVLALLAAAAVLVAPAGCGSGAPAASGRAAATTAAPVAAVAGAPAAGAGSTARVEPALPAPNRPLTAGERALLRPLFRDGIDYDQVRVIAARLLFQPADTYMTLGGNIYAPGPLFREDFSLRGDDRAVLVHEIGHVWQHANGLDLIAHALADFTTHRGDYEQAYWYRLEPGRDLADYGMEQQASILEDYYRITTARARADRMQNRGLSPRERDRLFASVLRRFLANARYARARAAGARRTSY